MNAPLPDAIRQALERVTLDDKYTLPAGRALMLGGIDPYTEGMYQNPDPASAAGQVSMTPELYTPGTGWRSLTGASSRREAQNATAAASSSKLFSATGMATKPQCDTPPTTASTASAPARSAGQVPCVCAAARSRIWSPMATPMRQASPARPTRRKRPNGRFWIGKSVSGVLADATQL